LAANRQLPHGSGRVENARPRPCRPPGPSTSSRTCGTSLRMT